MILDKVETNFLYEFDRMPAKFRTIHGAMVALGTRNYQTAYHLVKSLEIKGALSGVKSEMKRTMIYTVDPKVYNEAVELLFVNTASGEKEGAANEAHAGEAR